MNSPFYDIKLSYEENYKNGPRIKPAKRNLKCKTSYKFLGFDVNFPFGIPAGPLLNSKFTNAAFDLGFDVSTYKTVRSDFFPCHEFPNILFVKAPKKLHPDKISSLKAQNAYRGKISGIVITNSFGVPSQRPEIWQEDVKKALSYVKKRQLMILSFMGTVKENQSQKKFIEDFTLCARLASQTGAKVLEINLSCPNVGNEGLVCYDLELTEKICKIIRKEIKNKPLILKVGYYKNSNDLNRLAQIADKYANAIASINTIAARIVDKNGNQALPGETRLKSGVCGASIKWAGLEMVKRLNKIRKKKNYKFEIIGIGGVMTPKDYFDYRKLGANLVQSATGAMFNPNLASEIRNYEI